MHCSEPLHRYAVRKILGFDIVHVDGERALHIFKNGDCVETGLPNFNTARQWCVTHKSATCSQS